VIELSKHVFEALRRDEASILVAEGQRLLRVRSQKITESEPGKDAIAAVAANGRESSFVLVTVQDSGPGLDPAQLPHIFETCYTTKSSGMGMGLAISRSIIEAHYGRLWSAQIYRGARSFSSRCHPARFEGRQDMTITSPDSRYEAGSE
jgi:signal transduction histidine kinase